MDINTNYFGKVTYEKEDVIYLPEGLLGFENDREFLPIPFHEDSDSLVLLQSTEEEGLSFILMNPFSFFPDYAPELSEKDQKDLNVHAEEEVSYYVICVLKESLKDSTVNLKAPLAINAVERKGKQIVLDGSSYSLKEPLSHIEEGRA